jgi:hypothetical protein
MSAPAPSGPALNTRQAAAAAASATAEVAAAASAAAPPPPPQINAPGGAAPDAVTQALQAFTTMMAQQHLDSMALRAEAAASRAAQNAASELALAQQSRAAAGPAPLFVGKPNDIEAQRWLIALERWFGSAQVLASDNASRIAYAAASMRDSAQAWWAAETSSGRAAAITTWVQFATAIKAHFLPMDTERWAMQQRERLTSSSVKDVAVYTAKYAELDMLLPGETELSRVVAYERGLPERYRVKCAERRFATLGDAMSAMIAAWNAHESARGAGLHASLSNTDTTESSHQSSASSASSSFVVQPSSAHDPIADLRAQVAQLTAMMTERFRAPDHSRGPGGRGGSRSRQRDGQSRARSRTPGLSDEVVRARIKAGQCIKCGQAGHYKAECTNEAKLTN